MTVSTTLRAALALLAAIASPLAATAQSRIRAVHLSPDAPPIDIYIAGSASPTVSGLAFGGASAVVPVNGGAVRMKVTLAGLPQLTIFDADVSVPDSTTIDVLALNRIATPEASTIALPSGGQGSPDSSYIRLVDASPDAPSLDITITDAAGTPHTFSNVGFKSQTAFFAIPKGEFTAEVRSSGNNTTLLRVTGSVTAGERGTIFASGLAADLKLRLLYETRAAQQIPMVILTPVASAASARIRAVNVLPDSLGGQTVSADVTVGGAPLFTGIAPRTATALAAHDTGSFPFGITLQGTPTATGSIHLAADSAYTLVVHGAGSAQASTALLSRPIGRTVPHDSVLARVVDGSPSASPLTFIVRTSGGGGLREPLVLAKVSQWMMLPAGALDLLITGGGDAQLFRGTGSVPGGSIVTLIVTSTTAAPFRAHVLIESDSAAQAPMPELTPARRAGLRVVNAATGTDTLDIGFVDDQHHRLTVTAMTASPITDDFLGGPLAVATGWKYHFRGKPMEGSGSDVLQLSQDTLSTFVATTLVVHDGLGYFLRDSIEFLRIATTEADTPSAGRSLLRILHAFPQQALPQSRHPLDAVLQFADGTTLRHDSLIYGAITSYEDVPPGPVTLTFYETGYPTPLPICSATIPAGKTITMVIADAYAPGTTFIPEMDSRVMMQPYLLIDSDEGRTPLIPFSIAASVESARTGGAASLGVAPNPSRGDAAVTYTLPRRGPAVLSIYDMLGRPAARIDLGTHDAGTYTATVPAGGLPAGVYNMVLDGAATARTKLVILR